MIRVLLADDHTLVRTGLRLLLEAIPDVEVVAEAADGLEALQLIETHRPDCALIDLAMPRLNGLETLQRAAAHFPATRLLVVSMHADAPYVQQALAAGAAGYLLKDADKSELERAVRAVAAGGAYLTPAISGAVAARSELSVLTTRQREVLRLLAEGHSSKEMAARLGLSLKTVEAHRGAIMQRLGIRDIAGLVRLAVREGLVG
ncbi:MAG: response regulator containing a CheY-like receiver domain and an DNA-binding domain [Gemmatimonadetes bacterium]|nr:response regulator containing a CheY-like receiver domain and an DNA-binding domain [Gemmatimonadota bacterium]